MVYATNSRPRIYHDDPAFLQAHALFSDLPHDPWNLVPVVIGDLFELGHVELSDYGHHQPAVVVAPQLDRHATTDQALAALNDALGQLIAASTDLGDTLRYSRAQSYVHAAVAELTGHDTTAPSTRPR